MPGVFLLGRFLFGGFFVFAGMNHFMALGAIEGAAAARGMPFPRAAVIASGAMLLVGGATVILGVWQRVGCALIAIFLVTAMFTMHAFWAVPQEQVQMQLTLFLRNLALLGGSLVLYGLPLPWPYSVGSGAHLREHRPVRV